MSSHEAKNSRSLLDWQLWALPRGALTVRDLVVIAVLTLLSTALHGFGWLDGFETASLDAGLRLMPSDEIDEIRIVAITDHDYDELFASRSPLRLESLGKALEAIGRGKPSVIAVDLNLEPGQVPMNAFPADVPIVWARDATYMHGDLTMLDRAGQTSGAGPNYGLALFPQDGDGVVRRYRRQYPGDRRQFDSLPWATVRVYCRKLTQEGSEVPEVCEGAESPQADEELLLGFAGNRYAFAHLTLSNVLQASTGRAWADAGPLKDRIVVLGGTYRAARDEYVTPVGARNGVEIVAQAIASELRGSGIRDVNTVLLIGLEFVGGLLIAVIHHTFSVRRALLLSIFGIPALAMVSSIAAFLSFSRWANFAPVLVGTLIHQLFESAKEADKLEKAD